MSGRSACLALVSTLASCATAPASIPQTAHNLNTPAALVNACAGRDGWADPAPPARVIGNTYYVGTCGITVLLVTTPKGHILIDSGPTEAAPQVLANIRALGFDPRDVRWLLASHEHHDHVGGFAALKAATGAKIAALAAAARVLELGQPDPDDPQFGMLEATAPVQVNRFLTDGDFIEIATLRLAAHATPAHSAGSTSWTWQSCEGARCVAVAYADSVSTPAAKGYRFSDHPERATGVRQGLPAISRLPCDLLITPHPAASNLFVRFAGQAPLIAPDACRSYAEKAGRAFVERLAAEAKP